MENWKATFIQISLQFFFYATVGTVELENEESVENDESIAFCPYFQNRVPKRQLDLVDCRWYKDYSCCTQSEIDVLFTITGPQSTSNECREWITYLKCWVCSPRQHLFYSYQHLSVCENFCHKFFAACQNATLEETAIGVSNSDGIGFCLDRKFDVKADDSGQCYDFDPLIEIKNTAPSCGRMSAVFQTLIFMFILRS
uniref:Uncharacterized protein LOC102801915 n=1 Tax=Saccoglossus kowalevskii TaxID=10224 RepID=A0ABM0MQK7_SACKO|nr:PREDICTED: uncharacterized protein LOC102801915 [Saccoglossus kowalevskii]